jgi:hypothetical protein
MVWPFFHRLPKAARSRKLSHAEHRARLSLEVLEDRVVPHALSGFSPELDWTPARGTPAASTPTGSGGTSTAAASSAPAVPAYSSLPGAKATLYLDFAGDFTANWGSYSNITTPVYDTDGDPTTFSASELTNIQQIWARVAERYAPFNINVTTVAPTIMVKGVDMQIDIGGDSGWTGMLYGGISYIGSFTSTYIPSISFVFPAELGNGTPSYTGDAASHEAGHAFGLQHQATWSGTTLATDYYAGPGDGTAPIMGYSYNTARSMWWYGTNDVTSTTMQDDMAVIASATNGFGFRPNSWSGTSLTTAGALTVDGSGNISGSGIIEHMSDLDYFTFTTGAGALSLTVNVPSGYNTLDAKLELLDANGNVLATAYPNASFSATISYPATAGTYYLVVASDGMSSGATATSYGQDVGSYSLSGTIIPTATPAPAAPSNLTATAASSSQINLAWTDNSNNEDGFKIERQNSDGTWTQVATVGTNVTTWSDTGLAAGTTYTYRVRAYNAGGGNSAYSNLASATTNSLATVPAAPSGLAAASKTKPLRVNLTWVDNSNNETGFKIERSINGGVTWSLLATVGAGVTSYSDSSVANGNTYSYRVYAYNSAGNSADSNTVSITLGGGGSTGGGGGGGHHAAPLSANDLSATGSLGGDSQGGGTFTWVAATTVNGAATSGADSRSQTPSPQALEALIDNGGSSARQGTPWSLLFGVFDLSPDFNEAFIL